MIERYSVPEIARIFTEENRYKAFLKIELANLEALSTLNIIPRKYYTDTKDKAKINLERIHELEAQTKHDVIAFTRSIDELLGEEKKYFHYGLTSTDVVDSAMSLLYKEASDILIKDIRELLSVLKRRALETKDLPCIARTHGMHAEISSFGLKFARFFDEISRNLDRFIKAVDDLCVIKLEGAIGNFAFIHKEVEVLVADHFGLKNPKIATQVVSRDNHAYFLNCLALLASCYEDITVEFRNLSRTEIAEVQEFFSSGQKGSSAMPHKKNPISFENIGGLSRLVRGYAQVSFDNICLYHERDISHSSNERIIFPDALELMTYITRRLSKTLDQLIINEANVLRNIDMTNEIVYSQRLLNVLIDKGSTREAAYDCIQSLANTCRSENIKFIDIVKKDAFVKSLLTDEEITKLFDKEFYLANVEYIYKRVGLL